MKDTITLLMVIFTFIGMLILTFNPDLSSPKIKFKTFKSLYEVNPNRWMLYEKINSVIYYYEHSNKQQAFRFGFFEWFKFIFWGTKNSICDIKARRIQALSNVIHAVDKERALKDQQKEN